MRGRVARIFLKQLFTFCCRGPSKERALSHAGAKGGGDLFRGRLIRAEVNRRGFAAARGLEPEIGLLGIGAGPRVRPAD